MSALLVSAAAATANPLITHRNLHTGREPSASGLVSARKLLAPLVSHRARGDGSVPLPSSRATPTHRGRRERYFGSLFGRHEQQPAWAFPLAGHELVGISELATASNSTTPDHTYRDDPAHATRTRVGGSAGAGRHYVLGNGRPRGAHRLGSAPESPLSSTRVSDSHACDEYHRCISCLFSLYWLLRLELPSIPSSQGLGESANWNRLETVATPPRALPRPEPA